ncbi:hypothetical protein J6590_066384 [Homalodisca vitripennis]|nr:hypothetical protein J6590_066384 [Homalodisca vitripennis]
MLSWVLAESFRLDDANYAVSYWNYSDDAAKFSGERWRFGVMDDDEVSCLAIFLGSTLLGSELKHLDIFWFLSAPDVLEAMMDLRGPPTKKSTVVRGSWSFRFSEDHCLNAGTQSYKSFIS